MNRKVIRYIASPAVAVFALDVLPHAPEPDDCAADAGITLCNQNEDPWAIEPPNHHTPHQEFEAHLGPRRMRELRRSLESLREITDPYA